MSALGQKRTSATHKLMSALGPIADTNNFKSAPVLTLEESLNLAYHGARAEKQGFEIRLERWLDPTVGEADVFPQDITYCSI